MSGRPIKHVMTALQLWLKGDFLTLYMPVWSYIEVQKAMPIYGDVKADVARELFDKFGGVVRYFGHCMQAACKAVFLRTCSGLAGLS